MDNPQGPLPRGHWRNYQTPTKPAAKLLEEIVAQENSPSNRSKSSSSDSFVFLHPPKPSDGTPPFPPIPLHPPNFQSESVERTRTPPLPPFPAGMQPGPSVIAEDDVSAQQRKRSKSRKSKDSKESSSSLPRRLMEELQHLQDRRDTTSAFSPTDTHIGRHHHQSRTHGRARSASESISSLLVVTTERLARETARANEAERNATEVLALFKTTHEAKARLERDLDRVKQELGLYKVQLDVAQKEIFRAQEIVDRVERQRAAAEEDAARARDRINKLMEARAVEQAMEEGRRLGFEEGLRQGRFVQPVPEDRASRRHRDERDRTSGVSRYTYPEEQSQASGSSSSSGNRKNVPRSQAPPQRPASSTNRPPRQDIPENVRPRRGTSAGPSTGPPPAHPHGSPPDTGTFSNLLPRPTITTPIPVNVPSTQPQVAPPMPAHQPPTTIHDHPRPERISVQPQPPGDRNGPIHPIPVWNYSPSVMHERITLPPDNYIPTMDANSVINLPPPHELSYPVPPEAPPLNSSRDYASSHPRSGSRAAEPSQRAADRETIRTKDYAYPVKPSAGDDAASVAYTALSGGNDRAQKYASMQSRATSAFSRGSTHLSDLDLLTTPRYPPDRGRRQEEVERYTHLSTRRDTPSQSPTQRIAEEWRSANRQYLDSPAPTNASTQYEAPAPQSPEPPIRRPFSVTNNTRSRPPRRPREIVMPAPLADVFMNTPHTPRTQDRALNDHLTPPHHALRTTSTNTVPGIEIVTPSTHASSRLSEGTIVDPILLTPQSANRPLPLSNRSEQHSRGQYDHGASENDYQNHQSMLLADNNPPERFVPLSPIPGMTNLNPYPPGFAPSLPKDHEASSPDFRYPSSPLMRSH